MLCMFLLTALPDSVKLLFMKEKIKTLPFFVTRNPLRQWLLLREPVFPKMYGFSDAYHLRIVPFTPPVASNSNRRSRGTTSPIFSQSLTIERGVNRLYRDNPDPSTQIGSSDRSFR